MLDAAAGGMQMVTADQGGRQQHLAKALESSHLWVQLDAPDQQQEQVEREVALLSPYIQRSVLRAGHGVSRSTPVVLPKQVTPEVLQLLLQYCRYHRVTGHSDKERKIFDEKFIRLDTRRLCELTSAADSLEMKPLVDLTSRALARMIEGKSPEEIRSTFNLPDDLTEEEKLEPLKSGLADARIKLLNKLYAKKRQNLAVKKAAIGKPAQLQALPSQDDRPVDDLVNDIEGDRFASGKSGAKKGKKKGSVKPVPRERNSKGSHVGGETGAAPFLAQPATNGHALAQPARAAVNGSPAAVNGQQAASESGTARSGATAQPRLPAGDSVGSGSGSLDQDSDYAAESLARQLQSDWPARPTEMVSLTSLLNFRARRPTGACDDETSLSGSGCDSSSDTDTDSDDDDDVTHASSNGVSSLLQSSTGTSNCVRPHTPDVATAAVAAGGSSGCTQAGAATSASHSAPNATVVHAAEADSAQPADHPAESAGMQSLLGDHNSTVSAHQLHTKDASEANDMRMKPANESSIIPAQAALGCESAAVSRDSAARPSEAGPATEQAAHDPSAKQLPLPLPSASLRSSALAAPSDVESIDNWLGSGGAMGHPGLGRSTLPPCSAPPHGSGIVSSAGGGTVPGSSPPPGAETAAQLRAAHAAAALALEALNRGAVAEGSLQDVFAALANAFATAGTPHAAAASAAAPLPSPASSTQPGAVNDRGSKAQPSLPECATDFQAMSAVLKAFLGAVQAPALSLDPAERQAGRVAMVCGQDGSLAAHTQSGACVRLSWDFAPQN
mmetsp:Transcript_17412/g.52206  ORF Transcript_17412/g.52206 Transcript_17412/m.52206 type:complete len:786 (+) Transcript_17412:529-2886(+)